MPTPSRRGAGRVKGEALRGFAQRNGTLDASRPAAAALIYIVRALDAGQAKAAPRSGRSLHQRPKPAVGLTGFLLLKRLEVMHQSAIRGVDASPSALGL
jgi:hypothetical protein